MKNSSRIATAIPKTKISVAMPFERYCYTKEISAGRIKGELAIRRTEIKTKGMIIDALGISFKPVDSTTEIPLGLAAAPIRRIPNLEGRNTLRKIKTFSKAFYSIQVLANIDRRLMKSFQRGIPTYTVSSAVPHVKYSFVSMRNIVYFETGYPGYSLGQFINELAEISEEEINIQQKRILLLTVFRNIFAMLDNFPRKSHGDLHPLNILVSVQHEEPEVDSGQPIYIPSEIKTYAIDIGNRQYTIVQNLKEGKFSYTKQDDLQLLFSYLERWWSSQLHKLLGITQLTREKLMQMLEQPHIVTQQRLLSDIIQGYQLQRLQYLLNKATATHIKYTKQELGILSDEIRKIYEINEEGEGAPTVIMPYCNYSGRGKPC